MTSPPKRRWYAFRLRTLFVVLVVLGCVLAFTVMQVMEEPWNKQRYQTFSKALTQNSIWDDVRIRVFRLKPDKTSKGGSVGLTGRIRNNKRFFQGWPIVTTDQITSAELREYVYRILENPGTYDESGAWCFYPGLGIRISNGSDVIDYVVCLECDWVHTYFRKTLVSVRPLSDKGNSDLASFYRRMFPDSAD